MICIFRSHVARLKLRTAIDGNTGARDPARRIGRHKSDYVGNILGLAESLQCLHAQRDLASRFCFREIRHIRVDDAWSDGVYSNAARPENGSPVLRRMRADFRSSALNQASTDTSFVRPMD